MMRRLLVTSLGAAVLAAVTVAAQTSSSPAKAGKYTPPRTADGHADFSGVWSNNSVTPFERPKEWAGRDHITEQELEQLKGDIARVYDEGGDAIFQNVVEAALQKKHLTSYDVKTGNYNQFWMVERDIDTRTSLITDPPDGRLPARTPEAESRRRGRGLQVTTDEGGPAGRADGPEDRPLGERCITFGAPRTGGGYNSYFQFVQSPTTVGILQETIHDIRVIPIGGKPHLTSDVRQWLGDARGHWEGDTLVVETTNFKSRSVPYNATDKLKVTERFTRVSPTYINWELTFDDAATWTRPWTMMVRLKKEDKQIYEYACHESNYSLPGILAGFRAKEKGAASPTSTKSSR
jgi:hypothetical protein